MVMLCALEIKSKQVNVQQFMEKQTNFSLFTFIRKISGVQTLPKINFFKMFYVLFANFSVKYWLLQDWRELCDVYWKYCEINRR